LRQVLLHGLLEVHWLLASGWLESHHLKAEQVVGLDHGLLVP
jgi:hypothetical protein